MQEEGGFPYGLNTHIHCLAACLISMREGGREREDFHPPARSHTLSTPEDFLPVQIHDVGPEDKEEGHDEIDHVRGAEGGRGHGSGKDMTR